LAKRFVPDGHCQIFGGSLVAEFRQGLFAHSTVRATPLH
jgi:hypothetical protein